MSESNHTPGPWIAKLTISIESDWQTEIIRPTKRGSIGPSFIGIFEQGGERDYIVAAANASLIAAAPELLAALEACVTFLEEPADARPNARKASVQMARDAIAKAKGPQ